MLDAAGYDVVIIETVGVGQDEVDIVRTADVSIVTLVPGAGDEVQALKAGIMEIADIFVVNKADREGADRTAASIETMLSLEPWPADAWRPPVLRTVATTGAGVAELVETIDAVPADSTGDALGGAGARGPSGGCGKSWPPVHAARRARCARARGVRRARSIASRRARSIRMAQPNRCSSATARRAPGTTGRAALARLSLDHVGVAVRDAAALDVAVRSALRPRAPTSRKTSGRIGCASSAPAAQRIELVEAPTPRLADREVPGEARRPGCITCVSASPTSTRPSPR